MRLVIQLIKNHIEPYVKLQMFKAINRYYISNHNESLLENNSYYRVYCEISDSITNKKFDGMAEGETGLIAKLRAVAESYELICANDYGLKYNKNYPYGVGVGLRDKSAILRAFGEYYERLLFTKLRNNITSNLNQSFETLYGTVYVSIIKKNDIFGTGYGLTEIDSFDSANRSYLRKKDYPQEMQQFEIPISEPKIIRITPQNEPWLECYYIGFTY